MFRFQKEAQGMKYFIFAILALSPLFTYGQDVQVPGSQVLASVNSILTSGSARGVMPNGLGCRVTLVPVPSSQGTPDGYTLTIYDLADQPQESMVISNASSVTFNASPKNRIFQIPQPSGIVLVLGLSAHEDSSGFDLAIARVKHRRTQAVTCSIQK
jgi:hypothetical protein